MHRERNRRRKIIIGLLGILFLMAVGYSAFQSKLDIKGSTKVTSNWEVLITNVTPGTPTGNAENSKDENGNVILPTWDGLSASMSADLYEAGDSMEYIVTVTNRGNIDAVLDNIDGINAQSSHSEAVIITYSGYAKGQKLHRNSSMDIKVKVEYNPEYTGGEVTGTSEISFSYEQADIKEDDDDKPVIENDIIISKDDKTITYDCTENGGTGGHTSLFDIGSNVDLSVKCTKKGYTFLGWNTDKNATSTLNSYTMPAEDKTLYGIYQKIINISYEIDGPGITSLSKNSDSITIYNNDTYPNVNLPKINMKNNNYELHGWYIDDVFIGNSEDKYTFNESVTVRAVSEALPVMKKYSSYIDSNSKWNENTPDYHNNSIRETLTEIEFVDLDDITLNAPVEVDNITSWDVSEEQNESVIAWLDGTKIYIGSKNKVIFNEDSSYSFSQFTNVTAFHFDNNIDTSRVTAMRYMFYNCKNVISLNLSDFDTSNVTYMNSMFDNCIKATTIDVSSFDTSNVTDIQGLFNHCESVISLDLSNFNTSKVTNMVAMFQQCNKATTIDVSSFDTSNVTYMGGLFYGCNSVTSLDLSNFDTSKVINMMVMFYNCVAATTIDVSSFDTSSVTDMSYMFTNCSNLTKLDVSNFDTANVQNMNFTFANCSKLTELDLTSFSAQKVTSMTYMFYNNRLLEKIYALDTFVVPNGTSSENMFRNCSKLVGGNGTAVSTKNVYDKTYAKIDKSGQEGYFTDGNFLKEAIVNYSVTSKSILTTVTFGDTVNITKYEFKIDDGSWIDNGTNNSYRFDNLNKNTKYKISIRYTKDGEVITPSSKRIKTNEIETPFITSKYNSMTNGEVTIEYPEGCGSTFTCNYTKNDSSPIIVTEKNVTINFTEESEFTAYVTDGINEVSSSYTVTMPTKSFNNNGTIIPIVTFGDGLYEVDDRYVFRGTNPNNYINLSGEKYRIISIEDDGAIKVIKNDLMNGVAFDKEGTSNNRYSSSSDDYCHSQKGCNFWASNTTTLNEDGENITRIPGYVMYSYDESILYNLPNDEAYLNIWLNGGIYAGESLPGWFNNLPQNLQNSIVNHVFDISGYAGTYVLKWNGKIGIMSTMDYASSSSNQKLCGTIGSYSTRNTISSALKCIKTNWLSNTPSEILIGDKDGLYNNDEDFSTLSFIQQGINMHDSKYSYEELNFRPVFHLTSSIVLSGSGTNDGNIYQIS